MAPDATAAAAAATGCCWWIDVLVPPALDAVSSRMSLAEEPSDDGRDTWRELLPRSDND